MPLSTQYYTLCKRVVELRKNLLPKSFDAMGNYTPEVYDKTRGFVALVHAEIEFYIENLCLEVANYSVRNWHTSRTANSVAFGLHSLCYSGWGELGKRPEKLPDPTNQICIEARISDALKQYKQIVDANHGIKEDNLKWLLVPLSIRLSSDLDPNWLTSMSNFGVHRGGIVHQAGRINQPPDPKSSLNFVWRQIIPGLKRLDVRLKSLI